MKDIVQDTLVIHTDTCDKSDIIACFVIAVALKTLSSLAIGSASSAKDVSGGQWTRHAGVPETTKERVGMTAFLKTLIKLSFLQMRLPNSDDSENLVSLSSQEALACSAETETEEM